MLVSMLKAKIHLATVTQAELNYDGSCAIDRNFIETLGLFPFEQIQIYNKDNGERFTTYIIEAKPGSRIISLNGAAARKGAIGDRIIICAYHFISPEKISQHPPRALYLDPENSVIRSVLPD